MSHVCLSGEEGEDLYSDGVLESLVHAGTVSSPGKGPRGGGHTVGDRALAPRPWHPLIGYLSPRMCGGRWRGHCQKHTIICAFTPVSRKSLEPCLPPQTRGDTAPSEFFFPVVRPGRSGTVAHGNLGPPLKLTETPGRALFQLTGEVLSRSVASSSEILKTS